MTSPPTVTTPPTVDEVTKALSGVNDPEIHRPITELGMVKDIDIARDGTVRVDICLTVAGCPPRDSITRDAPGAARKLAGVSRMRVELDVTREERRRELQARRRGGGPEKETPFSNPGSLTKVCAI